MVLMSANDVHLQVDQETPPGAVWIVIEAHDNQSWVCMTGSRWEFNAELEVCEEERCQYLAVEVPAHVDGVVGHGPVLDEIIRLAVRAHRGTADSALSDALGRLDIREALTNSRNQGEAR